MITIGYSTRKSNPYFTELLKSTSGFKDIKVIEKINNGEKSLSVVYNETTYTDKPTINSYIKYYGTSE